MKIHVMPGLGVSSETELYTFTEKNVRIIGDLEAVALEINESWAKSVVSKQYTREVIAPFPYEAGLGYFVRYKRNGLWQGFGFCLTGYYRRRWLDNLAVGCLAATFGGGGTDHGVEGKYIKGVKEALGLL